MVANITRISELLEEEVASLPVRGPGYRELLVNTVKTLVEFEEEHRVERIDINIKFDAMFELLGRSFEGLNGETE